MIKTILIPISFANKPIDHADAYQFSKGQFAQELEQTAYSNFWIECSLPAVPHKDSLIELDDIDEQDMIEQLTKVFDKCKGFQRLMANFRNEKMEYTGDVTARDAIKYFCGFENKCDGVYSGCWYVDRVNFRANDEYMYVEIRQSL